MQATEISINAYTIKSFCRAFGVGRSLVYGEIAAGRLRVRKAGRRTLVLKRDADAWANSLPVPRFAPGCTPENDPAQRRLIR